jgi:hypothetical protein
VSAPAASGLLGVQTPLGQGASGWTGAYRSPVRNAPAALDLGRAALAAGLELRQSLSAPLVSDSAALVGVLSIYAGDAEAFTSDHERVVQTAAQIVTPHVARTAAARTPAAAAPRTAAPAAAAVPAASVGPTPAPRTAAPRTAAPQTAAERRRREAERPAGRLPTSIVFVAIDEAPAAREADELDEVEAREAPPALEQVRLCLRASDTVFAYSRDELLILLAATEPEMAHMVARRIQPCLSVPGLGQTVRYGVASSPTDGESLQALISVARRQVERRDLVAVRG